MSSFLLLAALGCLLPEPAPASLVRLDDEPAGANCAGGGVAISTGRDADASDALEDSEIQDTRYVCNGAAGADGANGEDGADGEDGEDGLPGEDGLDGLDGAELSLAEPEWIEQNTQTELVEGVADTAGFLVVDQGANDVVNTRISLGATPDTLERVGYDRGTLPVPAGWAWRVEVTNAGWAELRVLWVPIAPTGG